MGKKKGQEVREKKEKAKGKVKEQPTEIVAVKPEGKPKPKSKPKGKSARKAEK